MLQVKLLTLVLTLILPLMCQYLCIGDPKYLLLKKKKKKKPLLSFQFGIAIDIQSISPCPNDMAQNDIVSHLIIGNPNKRPQKLLKPKRNDYFQRSSPFGCQDKTGISEKLTHQFNWSAFFLPHKPKQHQTQNSNNNAVHCSSFFSEAKRNPRDLT